MASTLLMASPAIKMMVLWSAMAPMDSLGFNFNHPITACLPPTTRPSMKSHRCRRLGRGVRSDVLKLSMNPFDEELISTEDPIRLNCDDAAEENDNDDIIDSKSNPILYDKQYFTKEDPRSYNAGKNIDEETKAELDTIRDGPVDENYFNTKIEDGSNIIDNFWAGALQLQPQTQSSESSEQKKTRRRNPRMQMFAYLSQPIVEFRIICLVIISCFLEAINTIDDLPGNIHLGINAIDRFFIYLFAVEFFLRWWSAGRFQLRYLTKPLAAIDSIAVVIPLFLSGLLPLYDFGQMTGILPYVSLPGWLLASSSANSALLNLRLLRILKFQRVLTDENTYMNFEMALGMKKTDVRPYQLQLARVIISIFTLVSVSTGLIYTAEHEVNPQIPDYFTALYFGLTTLTTVGFGDITPVTFQGRCVVGGSILAGVAIIPAQAASLAEAYLDFQKERAPQEKGQPGITESTAIGKMKCDNCGAGPHRNDAEFCWSCGKLLE